MKEIKRKGEYEGLNIFFYAQINMKLRMNQMINKKCDYGLE